METLLAETPTEKETKPYAVQALYREFGEKAFSVQTCADGIPTLWVSGNSILEVMKFLKPRFCMLYDLFGIDERTRVHRSDQPPADFTVVYQLLSIKLLHRFFYTMLDNHCRHQKKKFYKEFL